MNATFETFSDHSRTSTHDIAFLTISDISNQMGISKSKLYKDIRDGKLIAEKSLDDTLVVSPRALQNAYGKFDAADLLEADFPVPECLDLLEDSPVDEEFAEPILVENILVEKSCEKSLDLVHEPATEAVEIITFNSPTEIEETAEIIPEKPDSPLNSKLIGLCTAVIFCSAILIGVFRYF